MTHLLAQPLLAVFGIGQTELIVVGIVVLVLFGHRLPTVMGSLGKGIRDFKRGVNDDSDEVAEKERLNKSEKADLR